MNKLKKLSLYILIFFLGSIAGWIYEEIFYRITDGVWVNRGFLYGPYLPVYGYGAVLIVLFTNKYRKNPLIVFLITMLLTGIFEYLTGLIMFKIWHHRWWDYRGLFLNIGGFVCLRSVISFGIGGLILIYLLDPIVEKIIKKISVNKLKVINTLIVLIIVIDTILSLIFRNSNL